MCGAGDTTDTGSASANRHQLKNCTSWFAIMKDTEEVIPDNINPGSGILDDGVLLDLLEFLPRTRDIVYVDKLMPTRVEHYVVNFLSHDFWFRSSTLHICLLCAPFAFYVLNLFLSRAFPELRAKICSFVTFLQKRLIPEGLFKLCSAELCGSCCPAVPWLVPFLTSLYWFSVLRFLVGEMRFRLSSYSNEMLYDIMFPVLLKHMSTEGSDDELFTDEGKLLSPDFSWSKDSLILILFVVAIFVNAIRLWVRGRLALRRFAFSRMSVAVFLVSFVLTIVYERLSCVSSPFYGEEKLLDDAHFFDVWNSSNISTLFYRDRVPVYGGSCLCGVLLDVDVPKNETMFEFLVQLLDEMTRMNETAEDSYSMVLDEPDAMNVTAEDSYLEGLVEGDPPPFLGEEDFDLIDEIMDPLLPTLKDEKMYEKLQEGILTDPKLFQDGDTHPAAKKLANNKEGLLEVYYTLTDAIMSDSIRQTSHLKTAGTIHHERGHEYYFELYVLIDLVLVWFVYNVAPILASAFGSLIVEMVSKLLLATALVTLSGYVFELLADSYILAYGDVLYEEAFYTAGRMTRVTEYGEHSHPPVVLRNLALRHGTLAFLLFPLLLLLVTSLLVHSVLPAQVRRKMTRRATWMLLLLLPSLYFLLALLLRLMYLGRDFSSPQGQVFSGTWVYWKSLLCLLGGGAYCAMMRRYVMQSEEELLGITVADEIATNKKSPVHQSRLVREFDQSRLGRRIQAGDSHDEGAVDREEDS